MDDGMINRMDTSPPHDTRSYRADSRVCNCVSLLLMNSTQKELLENTLGVRCHEVIIINEVVKKIKNSLQLTRGKLCMCKRGYKTLIIDTQNMPQKLELRYLISQIEPCYRAIQDEDTVFKLDIVVFWVENNGLNTPEMLKEEAGTANI